MNSHEKLSNNAIIIVAGRNAADTVDACLDSLLVQDYPDLGIVFFDDFSSDDTLGKAKAKLNGRPDTLVVPCSKSWGRLSCWKPAIKHFCSNPASVIILVNPEDRLSETHAVSTMMRSHAVYDVVCEGGLITRQGNNKARFNSFKKFLFNGIEEADFMDRNGNLLEFAEDRAVMAPIIEMAGKDRCYVLDSNLYDSSHKTDDRKAAAKKALCEAEVKSKRPYGIWHSVTFIVPCHNQCNELEAGIMPLIEQNVLVKIIIVNMGSTDNTREVCESLEKKYPTIVSCVHVGNVGIPAAKNTGAKAATTNFIVPFRLGDKISHIWLSECFFRMPRHVDVVYAPYCDKETGETITMYITGEDLKENDLVPGCCLMRKTVWEKLGGWMECEDENASNLDFWTRCLKKKVVFARNG